MQFFEWGDVLMVSNLSEFLAACISKIILPLIIIAEFKEWVKLSIFVTMPSIKQFVKNLFSDVIIHIVVGIGNQHTRVFYSCGMELSPQTVDHCGI